jgi:hypothetical protein
MRSNDSAVYQYLPRIKRDTLLYKFGQPCASSILPWTNATPICDTAPQITSGNTMVTYTQKAVALNYSGLTYNGDLNYGSRITSIVKPYGLVLDSVTYCQIYGTRVEVPCHTTRPDPGCQPYVIYSYKSCTPTSTTILLSSVINGVEKSMINPGPYNLNLSTGGLTYYPEPFRLQFLCTNSATNLPALNYGITSVKCDVPVDTSLVEILEIQTANGPHPDSITFSDRKTILHCTFLTNNDGTNYIRLKPKAFTKDTNVRFTIEHPRITTALLSTVRFVSVPARVEIYRSSISLYVDGLEPRVSVRNDEVAYGNEHSLNFGPMWVGGLTRLLLPDSLSFMLSIDTTGLENIRILEINSPSIIRTDSIRIHGKIKSFFCTAPTPLIGTVRFRSKSIFATQNTVSAIGIQNPPGFVFEQSYTHPNTFRQLGILNQFPRNLALQLINGNNVVQYIAPNPASDDITVRYILSRPADEIFLELINLLGVVVISTTLPKQDIGRYELPLDIHSIPNGMYLLKVRSNNNVETHPIMVSR